MQASKREVGQSWRTALARKEEVEAELAFYQQQSAGAMAERDQASLPAVVLHNSSLAALSPSFPCLSSTAI